MRFAPILIALAAQDAAEDTALLFVSKCIGKGQGNFHLYHRISDRELEIREGDRLKYEIFLTSGQPELKGGVDIQFRDGSSLRDSEARDSAGLRAHGDSVLENAKGRWLERAIDLKPVVGRAAYAWDIQCEGDQPGTYVQFLDNIAVEHKDGRKTWIYRDGPPPVDELHWREGYSKESELAAIPRSKVVEGPELAKIIEKEQSRAKLRELLKKHNKELDTMAQILKREGREELIEEVDKAKAAAPDPEGFDGSAEAFLKALHDSCHKLSHAHPLMARYTGHLVGHAHIDFQWLWEWPETIDVCRQTFGQAIRFMEEFPEFKFSQSSAALYLAVEEELPELFRKIQERVKSGHWEIVGGRWCEGDTNIISAESHARQFLYGQRYFREKFGRDCKVGWEPDTFGHTWQMPQILKLSGIENYYFCRAGRKQPLFYWEGPDATRVLAFDEPGLGTGSWYNGDLTGREFREMLKFHDKFGAREMLWVYGVGNHGGGPTLENIRTVLEWQKSKRLPAVKFSTATEFFEALRRQELRDVPTIRGDLNTIFEGCYTTHSDMKRWNRDSETLLVQAETLAAVASRFGFVYPREELRTNWRDVLWNHHHDTLPGTSIHPSYRLSRRQYERVLASARGIVRHATETIADQADVPAGSLFVFNSLAWRRDAAVEAEPRAGLPEGDLVAVAPSGESTPVQRTAEGKLVFVARDLPACGYRAYRIEPGKKSESVAVRDGSIVSDRFELEFDASTGCVTKLFDRKLKRDLISRPANELAVDIFMPPFGVGPAWEIGKYARTETPTKSNGATVVEAGPVRARVRVERGYGRSKWAQEILIYREMDLVEFGLDLDWQERGSAAKGVPFLKAHFGLPGGKFRTSIPFGEIERPADGKEIPALTWVELGTPESGVALLNDCKHGHSARGERLSLSIVRSSFAPDPAPDAGRQFVRYALLPRAGAANLTRRGFEFNTPASSCWTERDLRGSWAWGPVPKPKMPSELSFLSIGGPSVVTTGVKLAEDGREWIARFYESSGAAAEAAIESALGVKGAENVNLIEDPIGEADASKIPLRGYEIRTLKLRIGR
jgi:alpha-mannosidase